MWYHVAGVAGGPEDLELYVNGSNDAGTDYGTGGDLVYSEDGHASIGANFEGTHNLFSGQIDEVVVYNRVLSGEEIGTLMHRRPGSMENGLVGYWNLNEGQGQVAGDSSVSGNDGILGFTQEVDDSDPVWVESELLLMCTTEQVIKRDIDSAIEIKENILGQLETALGKEKAAQEILREMQQSRDTGEWSFLQVVKARVRVVWAIIKEMWAERKIEDSKDSLEDSLEILNSDDPQPAPATNNGRGRGRGPQIRGR